MASTEQRANAFRCIVPDERDQLATHRIKEILTSPPAATLRTGWDWIVPGIDGSGMTSRRAYGAEARHETVTMAR
jgi:hypothetical protein